MSTNASTILTLALQDIGVLAEGESMSAPQGADGLRRLNNLVSSWRTQQSLVLAVERFVFPLTADQQTYTLGLGGDLDAPRPTAVAGAGLYLNGLDSALSVTSITRSGYTATVTQTAHGLAVGDEVLIQGAAQSGYNGMQTVQTVPTADTYTYTLETTPTTPATGTLTASAVADQPIEIPRTVITDSAYQGIQIKNMSNAQFTMVYYNPTFPFGTIFLWPRPNTADNQLVLYLENVFGGFATLTRDYDFPSADGYAEALQYGIGERLWPAYRGASPFPDHLRTLGRNAMGLIKRNNNKLNDVNTDAQVLAYNPRGGYNINSDTGGGN